VQRIGLLVILERLNTLPKTQQQVVIKMLDGVLGQAGRQGGHPMEHMIQLHIEKLPEGIYLATSDDVQGLIAQGRTIQETIEIARDVAKKLIEAQTGTTLPTTP